MILNDSNLGENSAAVCKIGIPVVPNRSVAVKDRAFRRRRLPSVANAYKFAAAEIPKNFYFFKNNLFTPVVYIVSGLKHEADRCSGQFKWCFFYYQRACPNGEACKYPHKSKFEIDLVGDLGDFGVGKPKPQRVCRYYKRGNCIHMENCLFRHDNDNSMIATNNFLNTNNNQSASTNMPSTSRQPSKNPTKSISGRDAQNNETDTKIENNTRETTEADKHKPDDEADEQQEGACASPPLKTSLWVNAPEFVPRTRSYAQALHPEMLTDKESNAKMCPYVNKDGICRNIANCTYLHGEVCDMCERMVLHPFNEDMRKKHRQECIQQHEKNMELSFAIARSKEKTCGVCFEVIMEKATGEQRFGILPNCNHCFCLTCIRKWRQARQFENKIIRACPECRVTSDFVCPSMYWVDTKEDKEKLIDDYKKALSRKDCKYFKKGVGKCPFGNKCFYLHALANGTKCDVGPPPRQRRYRGLDNSDIEVLQQVMLWEFLDEREFPWSLADEIEDLVSFFTDSDESDWSDYDAFFD